MAICCGQLLELVMLIVLLSMKELPLEVTIRELFLVFVDEVLILILLSRHLDLTVSEFIVESGVELVIHLGVHFVLEVNVDVLASLHPLLLSQGHIASGEVHDVALLPERTIIPISLILTELLCAVLEVNDHVIVVIELSLLAVDPCPNFR
jgi:hypothetical protein